MSIRGSNIQHIESGRVRLFCITFCVPIRAVHARIRGTGRPSCAVRAFGLGKMSGASHKERGSALCPVLTFVTLVSFCGQHDSFRCCLRVTGLLATKRHKTHKTLVVQLSRFQRLLYCRIQTAHQSLCRGDPPALIESVDDQLPASPTSP